MPSSSQNHYDIAIIGGGLVGASLTLALKGSGYSIALIEATPHDANNPSFDDRTVALTYSSLRIFKNLGIWSELTSASPIRSIHVSRRGHIGSTLLNCSDIDTEALGYIVSNKDIGNALWHKLKQPDPELSLFCPDEPLNIETDDNGVTIQLKSQSISARLVILADGGRSKWTEQLHFNKETHSYAKSAIISYIDSDKAHDDRAWERFTEHGPIALLPYQDKRYVLAWTVDNADVDTILNLESDAFLSHIQQEFGFRAGRFLKAKAPIAYPLFLTKVSPIYMGRLLLIGNAAHQVHPVAGQGFNLGLREVASLHRLLIDAKKWDDDPANSNLMNEYADKANRDANNIVRFTDGLLSIFQYNNPMVAFPRSMTLGIIDKITPLRRAILAYSTGLSSEQNYLNKND